MARHDGSVPECQYTRIKLSFKPVSGIPETSGNIYDIAAVLCTILCTTSCFQIVCDIACDSDAAVAPVAEADTAWTRGGGTLLIDVDKS